MFMSLEQNRSVDDGKDGVCLLYTSAVGSVPGPGKDKRAARQLLLFQQFQGKGPFFRLGADHAKELFHPVRRGGGRGDPHRFRFLKQGLGQLPDIFRDVYKRQI